MHSCPFPHLPPLAKWQWFIVVQPSPELVKYLRDDNAFGLVSVK